jgi:hypothetical protein
VPISNELFVFDLWAHTDSGQMVGNSEAYRRISREKSGFRQLAKTPQSQLTKIPFFGGWN